LRILETEGYKVMPLHFFYVCTQRRATWLSELKISETLEH
jgi:hypothetical protein